MSKTAKSSVRVLFFSHSSELYGAPRSLLLLLEGAQREASRVLPQLATFGDGGLVAATRCLGISTHVLQGLPAKRPREKESVVTRGFRLLLRVVALVRTTALIARLKPDIVYVNSIARVEPIISAWLLRRRVILHVRESGEYYAGNGAQARIRRVVARRFSHRIIAVSNGIRRRLLACGVSPALITVIHNGICSEPIHPSVDALRQRALLGIPDGAIVLGFVGNVTHRKGIDFFLDVAHELAERDKRYRFLIVGGDPTDAYFRAMQRRRDDDPLLVSATQFIGNVDEPDALYMAMDVFAMTSRAEPFARVNLEAMRSGLPVVATDVDGNPEAVAHSATGFVVPFGDTGAFADAVDTLANDESLRASMGLAGKTRVQARFTLSSYIDQCLAVVGEAGSS